MRTPMLLLAASLLCPAIPLAARAESAPRPSVVISNLSIVEGDSGMTPFSATLSLMNYYYGGPPVTVRVTATPGTASEKDYVFAATEVTLGGDAGVPTVSGYILGDIEPEGDETFTLTAIPVAPDGGYASYFYSSGGIITIRDDDRARASQLHAEGVTVLEGDVGSKQVEIRVCLEPASTSEVRVKYRTEDGSAVAKVDYVPVDGILSFAPGEVLKTIVVEILGDTDFEPDETFGVALSDPSMALLGTPRAAVVIVNDDARPTEPDAMPPLVTVEPATDGGVPGEGGDARPGDDGDARLAGNDSGTLGAGGSSGNDGDARLAGNDSGTLGAGGAAGNDGETGGSSFGGGCSCSVGDTGHGSVGTLLLLGVGLAGWLRRRRHGC